MKNRLDSFIKEYAQTNLYDIFVCMYYNELEYYLMIFQKSLLNKIKDSQNYVYLLESDGRLFYYDKVYDYMHIEDIESIELLKKYKLAEIKDKYAISSFELMGIIENEQY